MRSIAAPASMSPMEEAWLWLAGAVGLPGVASFAGPGAGLRHPVPASRHTRTMYRLWRVKYLFMGTRLVTRIAGGASLAEVANYLRGNDMGSSASERKL